MSQPKTAIAIFAGTGGFSSGAEQAGFKHLLAIDFDSHAIESYKKNFPHTPIEQWNMFTMTSADVLRRAGIKKGQLDLLHLEPPCQGFSTSGNRDKDDKRNKLMLEVTPKLIREIKPKMFCVENVDGLVEGEYLPLFYELKAQLDNLTDYNWNFRILDALDYDTPTIRKRFIAIGVRKDVASEVTFPKPTTADYDTLRANRVCPWIKWLYTGYYFLECKKKSGNNFMFTITKTKNIQVKTVDGIKRWLTKEELLVFNGFPPSWKISGSLNEIWARVGNAVPPPLAKAVCSHISKIITGISPISHGEMPTKSRYVK